MHYTTIENFSRLISGQIGSHNGTTYCCKKCLHAYTSQELLNVHADDCCHVQRTKFPKHPRCRFTNFQRQLPAPFVVYADSESILKPVNADVDVTQGVDTGTESSTSVFQEHIPCRFAYKIVSGADPDFSRPLVMYRGDAAEMFVRKLQLEAKQVCGYITTLKPIEFTATDSLSFNSATTCHICAKQLEDDKVRDHCHIAGNYRCAAHS